MEILEYDGVDPTQVLALNHLSLGYNLTPERVTLIRELDPRPFPCFAIYALETGAIAGQVAMYNLPVMTADGPEGVGGICAVCTHPAFSRRGIAESLMDEAHTRMRTAGLRFSTLGTARHRGAYALYRRLGYETLHVAASTFARLADVRPRSDLRAEQAFGNRTRLADEFFSQAASGWLGFSRRTPGFLDLLVSTGDLPAGDVWLLWQGDELAGYALAGLSDSILSVNSLLLADGVPAWEAVAALAAGRQARYARLRLDHPSAALGSPRPAAGRLPHAAAGLGRLHAQAARP